jgi:hypothetical protein
VARLPKLLVSSVIRGTRSGEIHGGLYLVDLERGSAELKLDWNRADIDFSGRGGDRGLRGIAFHGSNILVASNSELLILDQDFAIRETFANPFLRHCHEICVAQDRVFLTSTGFDSVLSFDLKTRRFAGAWYLGERDGTFGLRPFDPGTFAGPAASNRFHLNSITVSESGLWLCGLSTPGLLHADGRRVALAAPLPPGTHNARMFEGGVLYNDTAADRVCHQRNGSVREIAVPDFPAGDIINVENLPPELARPRFARGLCVLPDGLIAGGSSPSTVAVYDLHAGRCIVQHTLSMDVRNAVHGLAPWPY